MCILRKLNINQGTLKMFQTSSCLFIVMFSLRKAFSSDVLFFHATSHEDEFLRIRFDVTRKEGF